MLNNIGRYDEAIKAFDKTPKINRQNRLAWYYKGEALNNRGGRYDEAIKVFDKALEINPHDSAAWYYKGEGSKQHRPI